MSPALERLRMACAAKRREAEATAKRQPLGAEGFDLGMAAAFEMVAIALLDERTMRRFIEQAEAQDPASPFPNTYTTTTTDTR